jgi:toxin FitB
MFLLDTNVVSELIRPRPAPQVENWIAGRDGGLLFLSTPTEAELRMGVAIMDKGKRRDALDREILGMLDEDFSGRILPFDSAAAQSYATVLVTRRALGRPIAVMDAQIAAIALSRGMTLVTRNLRDFQGLNLPLIDPFVPLP